MLQLKSSFDVIKTIIKTEKSTMIAAENKYMFLVNPKANKIQIKKAVEDIYKVKVDKVNTITSAGKLKRLKWHQPGYTAHSKKAVVTLQKGQKIDLT
jgi:large subunit ribosomal protein L23